MNSNHINKPTLGDYLSNYYSIYILAIKNGNFADRATIITCYFIVILIAFFVLSGCFLPRHLLIWHIYFCIIILCMLDTDNCPLHNTMFNVLKKYEKAEKAEKAENNKQFNIDDIKVLPFTKKTYKTVIFIVITLSLIGYICPNYSLNIVVKKILYKLNLIGKPNEDNNNYRIATEFEMHEKLTNKTKQIEHLNPNNDVHNKVADHILDIHNYEPLKSETNKYTASINVKEIDSGLSVFDKIEPIKIECTKVQSIPIKQNVQVDQQNKTIVGKETNVNLATMRDELRKFNDMIVMK